MKLLWISSRWPFPADDGAKQASAALTQGIAGLGHEISVVTFARERQLGPSPDPRIRLLAHYPADPLGSRVVRALRNLLSPLPVSVDPFAGFCLNWEQFRAESPDAVVIDGNHGFAAFNGVPCPWPIIYRAHNNESLLWEQAATISRPKIYFRMQARRMRAFESSLGKKAVAIAAISPPDTETFRSWFPHARVGWVPMGFHFRPPEPQPEGAITFGYLGRMDWPPNREGLSWFLERVWPEVRKRRPEARLKVAGSGEAGWLSAHEGFDWLGRITCVEELYRDAHAVIAPVHFGGGTKIKVVEAFSHGRPVFATLGARLGSGLSGENFALLSDDPAAWISAMVGADKGSLAKRGVAAFHEAEGIFGAEQAGRTFISLLTGKGA